MLSTSLCYVDSQAAEKPLWSELRRRDEVAMWRQNSSLCMVTDSCTFFLELCLLLEERYGCGSTRNKTMQSIRNTFFVAWIKMQACYWCLCVHLQWQSILEDIVQAYVSLVKSLKKKPWKFLEKKFLETE